MRSTLNIAILLIVVAGAATGAYFLAQHNASIARAAASQSLGAQALAAYHSGDYATAVPLLKKYVASPDVRDDKQRRNEILTYIVDAEAKIAPPPPLPAATTAPASVTVNPKDIDPTTNKQRIPHQPVPAGETVSMTIRELGNFEFDPTADADIPPDIKYLNGATVRLRGFMIPLNQAEDITDFALVPTLANCCFGQPPGVQHTINCKTEKGKAVQYTPDEISVTGKLTINVKRDQGYTYEIFDLQVSSVKLAE
ncbi:MAG TPA: DUF3299 domain-containing protein [Phycisphaerae bacterium]|nr:DUF3299 domain-containing protein [Phycisphaerae bacterium]